LEYRDSLGLLLGLVDFERFRGPRGPRVKFDLSRMEALLKRLGDPHLVVPSVHVAGTKGKGSTTAMVSSVLTGQGYRTGTFTSPHLHTFRERISVDGEPVSEREFASLVERVRPLVCEVSEDGRYGEVTLFETLTAMAFIHFREIGADFQVLEVGLGGRLDSTNLVAPEACAITSISLDHTAILGDSVDMIAREKAGIVKTGAPVVSAPQPPPAMEEIRQVCIEKDAPLLEVGRDIALTAGEEDLSGQSFTISGRLREYGLTMPLLGPHQLENAAVSVGVLECLMERGWEVGVDAFLRGFENVKWPCRLEVLERDPPLLCDGAHNPDSMERLAGFLEKFFEGRRPVVVFGASRDKNLGRMMDALAPLMPVVVVTQSRHPRAASLAELVKGFAMRGLEVHQSMDTWRAVQKARSLVSKNGYMVATGSLFLAAEVREVALGIEPELYGEFDMASSVLETRGSGI